MISTYMYKNKLRTDPDVGKYISDYPFHDMGWLRLVGSLRLYVFFAEYRLFYRALLQKRPVTVRSLLIVATQYVYTRERERAKVRTFRL